MTATHELYIRGRYATLLQLRTVADERLERPGADDEDYATAEDLRARIDELGRIAGALGVDLAR